MGWHRGTCGTCGEAPCVKLFGLARVCDVSLGSNSRLAAEVYYLGGLSRAPSTKIRAYNVGKNAFSIYVYVFLEFLAVTKHVWF